MSKFDVEFEGEDRLQEIFAKLSEKGLDNVVRSSLFSVGNEVLNNSKAIVPVDTSTLKNSGKVERPKAVDGKWTVEVTYGGSASKYALIVHENPNARHEEGKTYHYLKIPFDKAKETFADDIKKRIVFYMRGRG